jgi:AcrR family transcriptional regulator
MTEPRTQSPRIRHKRRQARQDILDTARHVLREQGLDAVTLTGVANELGMTKQALYHYFASKDALLSNLLTALFDAEIDALVAAVQAEPDDGKVLSTLIRAFYAHHIEDLDAFRLLYCESQLVSAPEHGFGPDVIRDKINPRTRNLFDVLESRLVRPGMPAKKRRLLRRLAFTAWTSALGLLTMLSVADNAGDPLVHSDAALLDTLADVFDGAV